MRISTRAAEFLHWFWPIFAYAFPVVFTMASFWNGRQLIWQPNSPVEAFGLIGLCYFSIVLLLSTRLSYFDGLYGYDRVVTFYSILNILAFALIVMQQVLKSESGSLPFGFQKISLLILSTLTLTTVLTAAISRLYKFRFYPFAERYIRIAGIIVRDLLPLGVLAAAIHLIVVRTNIRSVRTHGKAIHWIVIGFSLSVVLKYLHFRIIRPNIQHRRGYRISGIRALGDSVVELTVSGPPFDFFAGQFAYWNFHFRKYPLDERRLLFCSSAADNAVAVCMKTDEIHPRDLSKLQIGTRVSFDGPYGGFVRSTIEEKPKIFIAKDLGIIPIRHMLNHLADNHVMMPLTVFWQVATKEHLVFNEEILGLTKRLPGLRYLPVIEENLSIDTHSTIADYQPGVIDAGLVQQECPDITKTEYDVYICCPDYMERTLARTLKHLGVSQQNIHMPGRY